MDLQKRNQLIADYIAARGQPGVARVTQAEWAAIDILRQDSDIAEAASMRVRKHDDYTGLNFDGVDLAWNHCFPGRPLPAGPMLGDPERFARMSAADAVAELLFRDKYQDEREIRTVEVRRFFDGNTDEQSLAPGAALLPFDACRRLLLELADKPEALAVAASIFDLPSAECPADDTVWLQAERWFVWAQAPLKVVRAWVKPAGLRVARRATYDVLLPGNQVLPPKTYLCQLGLSKWFGVPTRRCRGPIYRRPELRHAPYPAERRTMSEDTWRRYREVILTKLPAGERETLEAALDRYHAFGRTGIPSAALFDAIESLLVHPKRDDGSSASIGFGRWSTSRRPPSSSDSPTTVATQPRAF